MPVSARLLAGKMQALGPEDSFQKDFAKVSGREIRVEVRSDALRQQEHVRLPGRHIQVQATGLQIIALPVVRGLPEYILQSPLAVAEIRERQPDVTLALVGRIVYRHQQRRGTGTVPGKGQETIPGP